MGLKSLFEFHPSLLSAVDLTPLLSRLPTPHCIGFTRLRVAPRGKNANTKVDQLGGRSSSIIHMEDRPPKRT